ncbi:MAG: MaoC family dehydratase N-terminal domain-containing protein [bacterium]|jgi:acyl dehydratase|nr:MaoC family dehydratase N-terminal domain-containing protein [bacterium]
MPLSTETVGRTIRPQEQDVDARWTMAYAAGLGDALDCYLDTLRPEGVVAHPLFPVALLWPQVRDGWRPADPAEGARGVHFTHDQIVHRLVRPGDRLTSSGLVAGVERRRSGAYQVVRLDTRAADGEPVATTWHGTLFRDVEVEGLDTWLDRPDPVAPLDGAQEPSEEEPIRIPATLGHVYTECARIWNPIHTDAGFAASVGLPGIILHGTATLALAVSALVRRIAGGDPERVRRIAGRFGAMVGLPSEVTLQVLPAPAGAPATVRFQVRNAAGDLAIRDGLLELR